MTSSNGRRDFEGWKVELVYKLQDGVCLRCGRTLIVGFHRHHKDGDHSNNSIANLELVCMQCHGGELFKTLQAQKQAHLQELSTLIQRGIAGEVAGAVLDKLLDAIKLALSLERQVYGIDVEEPPTNIRLESYTTITEHGLRKYEEGIRDGILKGMDLVSKKGGKKSD